MVVVAGWQLVGTVTKGLASVGWALIAPQSVRAMCVTVIGTVASSVAVRGMGSRVIESRP